MKEQDILREAMEEAGFNLPMVGESMGYRDSASVWAMVNRSRTMTVEKFVKFLACMGYRVKVVGRGREWELDEVADRKKYERKKKEVVEKVEKVEKVEEPKIFEEPKRRMVNGREVVEVSKGVWRWVER